MTRPKENDPAIIRKAAETLASEVFAWISDDSDSDLESITNDLISVMGRWNCDGYELAKELEDDLGYSPDSQLVEILDSAESYKRTSLRDACEQWVKETGAVGPMLDSKVTWTKHANYGVGVVWKNYTDGRSVVSFPDRGDIVGESGTIVLWEELSPIDSE